MCWQNAIRDKAMSLEPVIQVAVGVIKNSAGQVLISLRHAKLHQGGLWEFPGGKIEPGENVEQALARELKEELSINVLASCPLININHCYPDRSVQLKVLTVTEFSGIPHGMENQVIKWVEVDKLNQFQFPAANLPIVLAARLPPFYAILDDADDNDLLAKLDRIIKQDLSLVQVRFKRTAKPVLRGFIEAAYPICQQANVLMLVNSDCAIAGMPIDGLHLTSRHLLELHKRPEGVEWLAASCHNLAELKHAEAVGVDFAMLAPVLPTPTHPGAQALGWEGFAELVDHVNLPVFALGGLAKDDLIQARQAGGQGIAAIRAFLG